MAAPAFVADNTGNAFTGTSHAPSLGGATIGNLIMIISLQDGTAANNLTFSSATGIEALDGTDNTVTTLSGSPFVVGNPTAARLHIFLGRATAATVSPIWTQGADDHYTKIVEFSGVNAGTTQADILENGSAGGTSANFGTGTTVNAQSVVTLGADRLAIHVIGINDDLTGLAAFAGESGGDWILPAAIFESGTGTDGTIALMTADMPSAGTISGGSDTITSDAWGVCAFALIPVGAAAPGPSHPQRKAHRFMLMR